jgi:aerobic-type carbon monoxide dehydrogenase small subunit (CoxS/CutS family)
MNKKSVQATINESVEFLCEPRKFMKLRETLGLTGAKGSCNNGNCGANDFESAGEFVLGVAVEINGRR